MSDIKPWKTLQSETVLDDEYMKIRKEVCQLPDGNIIQNFFIKDSPDYVVVFCLTKDKQVILVRQYRHAVGDITLELPAGLQSRHDINVKEAARRELMEETGYSAKTLEHMGEVYADPTRTKAKLHIFYAPDSEKISMPAGKNYEQTEIELVEIEDLKKLIEQKTINSLTQIMVIQFILNHLNNDRT
jgi:8-oxo-dGTP pyrophosphatase MutT (NUDIX family)